MANIIKFLRSITPGSRPSSKTYGEAYLNFGDNQFGAFDSSNVARDLIGVPFFSASSTYVTQQAVNYQNQLYLAKTNISAGTFNSAQWYKIPAGMFVVIKVQTFIANGTYTPDANMMYCIIEGVAGGGAGGGVSGGTSYVLGGGGGGSGGYSKKTASRATVGASQPVTVGVGGAPVAGGTGGAGTATSVGTLITANGGGGGSFANTSNIGSTGAGGSAGTGDIGNPGNNGIGGFYNPAWGTANVQALFNKGGDSIWGQGGAAGGGNGFRGGGGGGAVVTASTAIAQGGAGGSGFVFITEFCSA